MALIITDFVGFLLGFLHEKIAFLPTLFIYMRKICNYQNYHYIMWKKFQRSLDHPILILQNSLLLKTVLIDHHYKKQIRIFGYCHICLNHLMFLQGVKYQKPLVRVQIVKFMIQPL